MIYFVTAREVGRVKIGYSADPHHRFSKLRGDSGAKVELERITSGELADELALHEQFAAARSHGEWFMLTDEIEALMLTLPVAAPMKPAKEEWRRGDALTGAVLARQISISRAYAHMILTGKQRPALSLALHIFKVTGWKHSSLQAVNDDECLGLAAAMPWRKRA